jgi:hypothetical protein
MYEAGVKATVPIVVRRLTSVVATTQQSLRTQAAAHCVDHAHALPLGIKFPTAGWFRGAGSLHGRDLFWLVDFARVAGK